MDDFIVIILEGAGEVLFVAFTLSGNEIQFGGVGHTLTGIRNIYGVGFREE